MKLLTIEVEDTVSTTAFTIDADVTVTKDGDTISGVLRAKTQMSDPSLEGDYHITPA